MNEKEFQQFLHDNIPLTKAMGISVEEFTPSKVAIKALLEPNVNHKGTAFGGSISSLMTICGWAMVFANIKEIDPDCHIVIHKSSINYLAPITRDFTAECTLDDTVIRDEFIDTYRKHKKSRIRLTVVCRDNDKSLAEFQGFYVAFK